MTSSTTQTQTCFGSSTVTESQPLVPIAFTSQLETDLERVVKTALDEDFASAGDITAMSVIPEGLKVQAKVVFKEAGVVAGLKVMERVFQLLDPQVEFTALTGDGTVIDKSEIPVVVARLTGAARSVLSGERTALNLIQRLSGIATMTYSFVKVAQLAGIAILDTRKTTAGLRSLEKYAVRLGGGVSHRSGLYDRVLIKDNHVRIAGGVTEALRRAREGRPGEAIEVEVTTLFEVEEAVRGQAEIIMLDNMQPDTIREAVQIIGGRSFVEVSGGIKLNNLSDYLIEGVDAISVGALTHSIKSIDISLEIEG
jgi:nicotinate-nucleotide pyrophosphorylase (carboxylating)